MSNLLILLLAVPFGTAIVVALLGTQRVDAVRWLSLAATIVCLVCAVIVAVHFAGLPDHSNTGPFQPELVPGSTPDKPHATTWDLIPMQQSVADGQVKTAAIQFFVGIDGINVWLVVLTALLMVPSILISWTAITERQNEFFAWLLALATGLFGVFLAFDIVLFYFFFELTLVPLFFLIGIWGGPQRQYAARKFFIYTLTGGLITLLGVLGLVLTLAQQKTFSGELTFSIPELVARVAKLNTELPQKVLAEQTSVANAMTEAARAGAPNQNNPAVDVARAQLKQAEDRLAFWRQVQLWVFAGMMVGFAVKVPLVPLHTWLPLAHVEAPTAGSVLLAGVLLKIGTYGFLRLCVPLAPDASLRFGAPLLASLAVVGVLYGSLCALAQEDIKKLVAYSSVAHLGFCILGLFALNEVGLTGSLLVMINHGLSTGALFLLVGMLYERYHTRRMADYGGLAARLKLLALFWVFIALTSIGLPGLNGFWGELSVLMGMADFQGSQVHGWVLTVLASLGLVLGAWYMLTLLRRVFFGEVKEPAHEGHGHVTDLDFRELAALVPIAVLCVALGVYPKPFLDSVAPDVRKVVRLADDARRLNHRDTEAQRSQKTEDRGPRTEDQGLKRER
jgi:NADH-quinone oxidoreductase subunit M